MKQINLTIDTCFRHPLRWGVCPVNVRYHVFGVKVAYGSDVPGYIGKLWSVTFYFYNWFYSFSNFPHNQ